MVLASKDAPFNVRPVAAYMASVMVAAFAGFGVTQVDKLLAFFQQGLSNLGVYNVATVGAAVASFAPTAVTNVLVPTLGSLRPDEGARRRELMRNYTRYIIFIAAPMGAGLAAVSPFLLELFGREYLSAAPLLAVISVSVAFTSVGAVYSSDLLVGARIYLFSVANIVGLVALVTLALVLVPLFGSKGTQRGNENVRDSGRGKRGDCRPDSRDIVHTEIAKPLLEECEEFVKLGNPESRECGNHDRGHVGRHRSDAEGRILRGEHHPRRQGSRSRSEDKVADGETNEDAADSIPKKHEESSDGIPQSTRRNEELTGQRRSPRPDERVDTKLGEGVGNGVEGCVDERFRTQRGRERCSYRRIRENDRRGG